MRRDLGAKRVPFDVAGKDQQFDCDQLAWEIEDATGLRLGDFHQRCGRHGYLDCRSGTAGYVAIHLVTATSPGAHADGWRVRDRLCGPERTAIQGLVKDHAPSLQRWVGEHDDLVRHFADSVALIEVENEKGALSAGSGFLFGRPDILITARHVVEDRTIKRVLFGEDEAAADVITTSDVTDLALVRLSEPRITPILHEDSGERDESGLLGTRLLAMGYPDEPGFEQRNLAFKPVHLADTNRHYLGEGDLLKMSEHLEPGFSGGPVVNSCHAVVGLLIGFPDKQGDEILRCGWAIPSSRLAAFLGESMP